MRKILCVLLSAVLAVSALSGCAVQKNPDADDGKLHVVTTIFAPYDFARQVGGDDVSVTMLLRPGCEVHAYEPTPKDIIAIRNADVFIYVGGVSDAWVADVLESVGDGVRTVTLMDCVELAVDAGQISASMIQRKHRVGYARAGRLIDEMAARGLVSQSEGSKSREVLITREQYRELFGEDGEDDIDAE